MNTDKKNSGIWIRMTFGRYLRGFGAWGAGLVSAFAGIDDSLEAFEGGTGGGKGVAGLGFASGGGGAVGPLSVGAAFGEDLSAEGVRVWTPRSVRRSVWTGNYYSVAVWVSHPALPVIRPAVTIGRVSMTRHHRLDAHFSGALHDCFKIVDLEPEEHPVSIWLIVTIADRTVMMFHLETVQLKDKLPIRDQLFICGAPMIAPAAEQTLVPSAARFHIGHSNQRLRTHSASLSIHTDAMVTCFGRFLSSESGGRCDRCPRKRS
jgi:hypothetical protein